MTNNATKTYQVTVIERALAFYEVKAEDARGAAENWQDGQFHGRDDEALDTEGPSSVRERQPDGTWRKVPPSEWEAVPEITRVTDVEAERQRQAAGTLLAALGAFLEADALAEECGEWKWENLHPAFHSAREAVAEAKAAGIDPAPGARAAAGRVPGRFEIEHDPEENPYRAYVRVDGTFDVAIIRTDEGVVVDVYPKDWDFPIDTMTVWDDEVAEAMAEAEAGDAGEA